MTDRGDYDKLITAARRYARVENNGRGRHRKLVFPDGSHVAIPGTPGSGKAYTSFRQRLRAKGVPV